MTDSGQQRPVRRPVVVTAIMLVVTAIMIVAFRSWLDRPAAEIGIGQESNTAAEVVEPAFEPVPVEPDVAVLPPPPPAEVPIPVVTQSGPTTVIMLPVRVGSDDPAAAAVTDAVNQSALRALRAMPRINVIEISAAELAGIVPPNAGRLGEDNLVYLAVSRRYEARIVAEISEQSGADIPFWQISVRVRRPNGGGGNGSGVSKNSQSTGRDAESLGVRFAERIAQDAARVGGDAPGGPSSDPGAADARNVLLDPTRSETDRLRSLSALRGEGLDSAAIAAAVDLATRSTSASTRLRVWTLLRGSTYDATLAQPLSYALLFDLDAAVRKEAALGLAAYIGDPAAAAALQQALRNDSSPEVRLAASMATMTFDEQQDFKRQTLLDRSLAPAERLAPMMMNGGIGSMEMFGRSSGNDAMEEALAYAEIVTAVEDPEMKLWALSALQMPALSGAASNVGSADISKIVGALIETSRHADERVRRQALQGLSSVTRLNGNTEARAVLESVVENEPALAAELRIPEALSRQTLLPPGR